MRIDPICTCVLAYLTAAPLCAQTIDQLRDLLRDSARNGRQVAFLAGLVDLSETSELAAADLRVHGDPHLDVTTLKLPLHRTLDLGRDWPAMRLEAGLGWFAGRTLFRDVWRGSLPGAETEARVRYDAISGYVGLGPRLDLGTDLALTPLADASLAYVTNDTDYAGPGAAITGALADGILFNWSAATIAYGGALLLEHDLELEHDRHLRSLVRYDLRAFDTIRSTDRAQDANASLQRAVARSEYAAPLGLDLFERPLHWNAHAAYVRYLGGDQDILGFVDYFEFGVGLTAPLRNNAPEASRVALSAAAIVGEDVRGYSIGLGITF